MKRITCFIVTILKGIKNVIRAFFHSIVLCMRVIKGIFRMMFQNTLKFLKRTRDYLVDMYHAITDMLVQFLTALWELVTALALLLTLYIPAIAGFFVFTYLWPEKLVYWGVWGYAALMTLIGVFYRPEGVSLLGQSDADLSKFFSPKSDYEGV